MILPRARKDGLLIKEMPDETLVYDLESHEAHCLNHSAALVWQHCDGRTPVAKVAELLREELNTQVEVDVVWLALRQLKRFHLLEEVSEAMLSSPPVSRRNLVLKYAPAALVLPLILSISAPTAAQAATPGRCATPPFPQGCPCSADSDCQTQNCNAGVCGPMLKANPGG